MKKHIALILSTLVIFAGCTPAATTTKAANGTTAAVEQKEVKAVDAEINKPITFKNFEITVTKVEKAKDIHDKDAVKITYNFKNLSDAALSATSASNITVMQDGKALPVATSQDKGAAKTKEKVEKGQEVKDCVAVFSPQGDKDLEILVETFGKQEKEKAVIKTALPK